MSILKSHTNLPNTDTMSREGIFFVLPTNEVFLSSLYPIHEVVWTGFSLNYMMKPLIAFTSLDLFPTGQQTNTMAY